MPAGLKTVLNPALSSARVNASMKSLPTPSAAILETASWGIARSPLTALHSTRPSPAEPRANTNRCNRFRS
jgi:hypothetical protein